MNDTTLGIVVSTTDYKDSDKILTVFTKDFGKVSLYARGVNKLTSHNSYGCQPYQLAEFQFDYNPAKNTQTLKTAIVKNGYKNIKESYDLMVIAGIVGEIASQLDENLFDLLNKTYHYLNDNKEPYTILNIFLVNVLQLLGISPIVDECVVCGDKKHIETLSIEDGGFICHDCNQETGYPVMDVNFLYRFRLINKASFEVIDKVYGLKLNDYELTTKLLEFLSFHSGLIIKSLKALEEFH